MQGNNMILEKDEILQLVRIAAISKNKLRARMINHYRQNINPSKIVDINNKTLFDYATEEKNEKAIAHLLTFESNAESDDSVQKQEKFTLQKENKSTIMEHPTIKSPTINLLEKFCKQVVDAIVPDHDEIFIYVTLFNGVLVNLKNGIDITATVGSFPDTFIKRFENFYAKLHTTGDCFSLNKLRTCLKITILFLTGCADNLFLNRMNYLTLEQIKRAFVLIKDKTEIHASGYLASKYADLFIQFMHHPENTLVHALENIIVEKPRCLLREKSASLSNLCLLITPLEIPVQRPRSASLPDSQLIEKTLNEINSTEEVFCKNMHSLIEALEKVQKEEESPLLKKEYSKNFLTSIEIETLKFNFFKDLKDSDEVYTNRYKLLNVFSYWDFEERIIIMLKIAKKYEMLNNSADSVKIQTACKLSSLKDQNGYNIYTHPQNGLNSLLIQPMQRIIRYQFLLEALLEHAKKAKVSRQEINNINYTLKICKNFAKNCNTLMEPAYCLKNPFQYANLNKVTRLPEFTAKPS